MPNLITAARLAKIKARAKAATPGPWKWEGHAHAQWNGEVGSIRVWGDENDNRTVFGEVVLDASDATHIAHSRTDVPDLVATLERAVELLRDVVCICEELDTGDGVCNSCKLRDGFLGEFDHE